MLRFSIAQPHRRIWWAAYGLSACAFAWAQPAGSVQQDRQPTWQASQASTPVQPVVFKSVFADLPKGVETTILDWKAANANVGQFKRGYVDLLKWEQEQADKARKASNSPAKAAPMPAAPAPSKAGGQP